MASVGAGAGPLNLTARLLQTFPGLAAGGFRITSPSTYDYNCIAWAGERTDQWWWPNNPDGYWPPDIPSEVTLAAFEAAFETLGYQRCSDASLEADQVKIAIYLERNGVPSHAARQLPSGRWTSKLGPNVDIEHADPAAIQGAEYGLPVLIMARQIHPVL